MNLKLSSIALSKTFRKTIVAIYIVTLAVSTISCATKRQVNSLSEKQKTDSIEAVRTQTRTSNILDSILTRLSVSIDSIEEVTTVMWLPMTDSPEERKELVTTSSGITSTASKVPMKTSMVPVDNSSVPMLQRKVTMHGVRVEEEKKQSSTAKEQVHDSINWRSAYSERNYDSYAKKETRPSWSLYVLPVLYGILTLTAIIAIAIYIRRKLNQ